jgi:hypothetical protein
MNLSTLDTTDEENDDTKHNDSNLDSIENTIGSGNRPSTVAGTHTLF